jgi:hypothetical protein
MQDYEPYFDGAQASVFEIPATAGWNQLAACVRILTDQA